MAVQNEPVQRKMANLIASIPASSRRKMDKEIDFENKQDIQGGTVPLHIGRIAARMTGDWEGTIGDHLGLTNAERKDILGRYPQKPELQRREALNKWKSRLGSAATYKALIEVFVKAGRMALAESVVEILKEGAEVTDESNPQPGTVVIHKSETPGKNVILADVRQESMIVSGPRPPTQSPEQEAKKHNINRPVTMRVRDSDPLSEEFATKSRVDRMDQQVLPVYAKFGFDLLKLFKDKEVSVDDAMFVVTYCESAITSEMREAKDIQTFLRALKGTQSWYNFDVTANLAVLLGDEEGEKLVESYESKLKMHFNKRKITAKTQQCVMKINDTHEHFTQEELIKFQNTVMRILKLEEGDLILRGIEEGCVELTYLIQSTLAPKIRHIIETDECVNELKKLQIISVSINGEVVWSQQQEKETSQHHDLMHGHGKVTEPKQLQRLSDIIKAPSRGHPKSIKFRSGQAMAETTLEEIKYRFSQLVVDIQSSMEERKLEKCDALCLYSVTASVVSQTMMILTQSLTP